MLVEETAPPDAFDLAEPFDIRKNLPPEFSEWVVSTKWKERKDALEALLTASQIPRIKEENYTEIISTLGKSMKDSNIVVVTVAAQCVEAIAKGLRKGFAQYRSLVMAPMVEKLKERKQSVVDAIGGAMDAVFSSLGLSEVLDDIQEGLKHKNPQVRTESARFLVRCLRTTPFNPNKSEISVIGETCTKLLTDTFEPVRNAAAEALGTLMKIIGERQMIQFLEGIDEIRKAKVQEFFEKAEVKAKPRPQPKAAVGAAPAGGAAKPKVAGAPGSRMSMARPGMAKPAPAVKRPSSAASSIDKEPDSPKKPGIARPGVKPPATTTTANSRIAHRQSMVAPPRPASPPVPAVAAKKPAVEETSSAPAPKLGRGLMGRVCLSKMALLTIVYSYSYG